MMSCELAKIIVPDIAAADASPLGEEKKAVDDGLPQLTDTFLDGSSPDEVSQLRPFSGNLRLTPWFAQI